MNLEHGHCHDLLDALSDYLDGEASAELCRAIQAHLAGCGKCRIVVDTLRMTVKLYRELPQPDLSTGSRERLYKALDLSEFLDRR
jgi:predicted anti-sigma-YlaC factor YlaD